MINILSEQMQGFNHLEDFFKFINANIFQGTYLCSYLMDSM